MTTPPPIEAGPPQDEPSRRDLICPATGEICLSAVKAEAGEQPVCGIGPIAAIYHGITTPEGPAIGIGVACPRELGVVGSLAELIARQVPGTYPIHIRVRPDDEFPFQAPRLRAPEPRRSEDE